MNAIEIDNLTKVYKGKKGAKIKALRNLNLTVKQGEVFGFLGPNGAGKSTTIKALVGLIKASDGHARIKGIDVSQKEARKSVGYLPENPSFYDFLTAEEYLTFVGKTFAMSGTRLRSKCDEVLKMLGLWDARKRALKSYSKGMVQRVAIAQALIHDPDIYILDEPMSGLDPLGRALVKEIIMSLKERGKTVFFSTHVTADVERVCDRVGVIIKGVLCQQRVVSELLQEGVHGYFCRLKNVNEDIATRYNLDARKNCTVETFIDRKKFNEFASDFLGNGGTFELIEPSRRDIEDYFLELVQQADSNS